MLFLFILATDLGWERNRSLVELFKHNRWLNTIDLLGHIKGRLFNHFLIYPFVARVLHISGLIELLSLLVDVRHMVFSGWHIIKWTALNRHL